MAEAAADGQRYCKCAVTSRLKRRATACATAAYTASTQSGPWQVRRACRKPDRAGVYGAPQTPAVNEKALSDANLVDKTASGPTEGVLTITERDFGYGAIRTPKLGAEVGIVVLRSEI